MDRSAFPESAGRWNQCHKVSCCSARSLSRAELYLQGWWRSTAPECRRLGRVRHDSDGRDHRDQCRRHKREIVTVEAGNPREVTFLDHKWGSCQTNCSRVSFNRVAPDSRRLCAPQGQGNPFWSASYLWPVYGDSCAAGAIRGSCNLESSELTSRLGAVAASKRSGSSGLGLRLLPCPLSIVQIVATTARQPAKAAILARQSLVPGLL